MTDEQYYRLYLDGDETGLSELMKKYGSALTLYINGYLHDLHEAEDLMIEVFTYLFVKKPRIREGGLKAYLYKSARHMAIRHRKKLHLSFSMENLSEEPESDLLVEEVVKTKEQNEILHFCMKQLQQNYREALYLVYFENMSYAQTAEVMGKSVKQLPIWFIEESTVCGDFWKRRELRMRNHEERLEEVQKRIAQVQYKQKQRRSYMMAVSSVAICLVVIVGLASVMPGVAQNIIVSDYDTFKTTASIFTEGTMFGYLLIGLIAFVLGVCVTILCLHIHNLQKEEKEMGDKDDRNHR